MSSAVTGGHLDAAACLDLGSFTVLQNQLSWRPALRTHESRQSRLGWQWQTGCSSRNCNKRPWVWGATTYGAGWAAVLELVAQHLAARGVNRGWAAQHHIVSSFTVRC